MAMRGAMRSWRDRTCRTLPANARPRMNFSLWPRYSSRSHFARLLKELHDLMRDVARFGKRSESERGNELEVFSAHVFGGRVVVVAAGVVEFVAAEVVVPIRGQFEVLASALAVVALAAQRPLAEFPRSVAALHEAEAFTVRIEMLVHVPRVHRRSIIVE